MSSAIWQHFTKVKDPISGKTTHGKCVTCSKQISSNGTSAMKKHAMKHGLNVSLGHSSNSTELTTTIELVQPTIEKYFSKINTDSLPSLISKFCSNGSSFLAMASTEMTSLLSKAGYTNVPKSANGVKNQVMSFANEVKSLYIEEIANELKNLSVLSVGFDEWTSLGNRRYMNVFLYSPDKHWNLGLIRIRGKTDANLLLNDLETHLSKFGVSTSDLLCMCTDGAAINRRMSMNANLYQQECLSHGIQLAITDVLYKNKETQADDFTGEDSDEADENTIEDFDDEEELDELCQLAFSENVSEERPVLKLSSLKNVVKKVRKIVHFFRKSPVRNDQLQDRIEEDYSKAKSLIKDCPTRWSSLNQMLTRFYDLREHVDLCIHFLLKNDKSYLMSDEEYELINVLISTLTPVEQCVNALCRQSCSLYDAHLAIEVVLEELSLLSNPIAKELKKLIIEKQQTRFSDLYYLQLYLEDMSLINNPKYFKSMPSKEKLFEIMGQVLKKPIDKDIFTTDYSQSGSSNQSSTEMSFQEKVTAKKQKTNYLDQTPESQIANEIFIYDQTGVLGKYLTTILQCTQTVRPTTTDCERAFSVAGYFCSKLRVKLSEESLSNLCFLKSYFKRF